MNQSKKALPKKCFFHGADSRTRTDDLRITNALLYQLSHISKYYVCYALQCNYAFSAAKCIIKYFSDFFKCFNAFSVKIC